MSSRRAGWSVAALGLAALAGCSGPTTGVIVVIDADPGVYGATMRYDVNVVTTAETRHFPLERAAPQSFFIHASGAMSRADITVQAMSGAERVAVAHAVLARFIPGEVRVLHMHLYDACQCVASSCPCDAMQQRTCDATGMCVDPLQNPEQLPQQLPDGAVIAPDVPSAPDVEVDASDVVPVDDVPTDVAMDAGIDAPVDVAMDAPVDVPQDVPVPRDVPADVPTDSPSMPSCTPQASVGGSDNAVAVDYAIDRFVGATISLSGPSSSPSVAVWTVPPHLDTVTPVANTTAGFSGAGTGDEIALAALPAAFGGGAPHALVVAYSQSSPSPSAWLVRLDATAGPVTELLDPLGSGPGGYSRMRVAANQNNVLLCGEHTAASSTVCQLYAWGASNALIAHVPQLSIAGDLIAVAATSDTNTFELLTVSGSTLNDSRVDAAAGSTASTTTTNISPPMGPGIAPDRSRQNAVWVDTGSGAGQWWYVTPSPGMIGGTSLFVFQVAPSSMFLPPAVAINPVTSSLVDEPLGIARAVDGGTYTMVVTWTNAPGAVMGAHTTLDPHRVPTPGMMPTPLTGVTFASATLGHAITGSALSPLAPHEPTGTDTWGIGLLENPGGTTFAQIAQGPVGGATCALP